MIFWTARNPLRWAALVFLATLLAYSAVQAAVPAASAYRDDVIRESRAVWGLSAPVAAMAGQIEQESAWRPNVCSAYACGLTQFTPATAAWIAGAHAAQLSDADVFNPAWAIRALAIYDHDLWLTVPPAAADCDRWAFALSSYNGGLVNLQRDVALCRAGCKPNTWFGNVELHSVRGAAAFKENRGYPRAILRQRQFTYSSWGAIVPCSRY